MREASCKLKYLKILAFALAMPLGASAEQGVPARVEESRNLEADARLAQAHTLPILLSFSSEHCGYCALLEEDFLKPMLISGDYQDKILIRKIIIDSGHNLVDFDGATVGSDQLASRYRVKVVPTVLFVDARGQELAERMVGINTPEFYGGYLDQNIDTALSRVRVTPSAAPSARAGGGD